ncbi:accessory gene regulator B family protein [Alkalihalobacillus oceani]|uniref:Accessory gene regulator B family protein n=1 Tax=Halalkalibacter oceani TaxID=1653776 RepID=A0A9X2DSI9_9BACI|nr:accessory gene regulator B family protein [Halalkalibacter oceani]MCM3716159.1 accessory gene regulator B family protein [Halalkalibacter oceani]
MIEHWATLAASKIKNMNPEETAPHDVLVFGFTILINLFITFSLILLAGFLFGKTWLAFQVALSFMVIRILTGGAHLDRSLACSINSLCLVVLFLWLPITNALILVYAAVAFLLIIRFAPYYEPHQMKHSAEWEAKKKKAALACIVLFPVLFFTLQTPGFVTGALLQALLLTPFGISATHKLNTFTNKGGDYLEKRTS